ncbi:MAG: hypothetical protein ACXWRA_09870 [Pseudobdellovibrionaceae bacterium]
MSINKTFFILSLALNLFFFQRVQAADPVDTKLFQAVRIDGIDNSVLEGQAESAPQDDVTFTYDPNDLGDAPLMNVSFARLQELSQEMQSESYKESLETKVVVPLSTAEQEELDGLKVLKPEEIPLFLSKKNRFLEKVAKFFTVLHLKPASINKMLSLMNKQFYKNAGVIASANSRVLSIQLGVAGGVGLADWLMARLKKSPYLKDLPDSTGFYFMLSTGISIVRTVKNGKTRLSLEPIVEFRRATRIFSPFIFGAAGLTGSNTWENRRESTSLQKVNFFRISSLNGLSGVQQFGFAASAALAFPPGGGAVAGMEGEVYRLRLTHEILLQMMQMMRNFIFKSKIETCSGIFP